MHKVAPFSLRQAMGVGKLHFARILGCHRNTVTNWEHGHCSPSPFAAHKLHLIRKQFDRSRNPRFPVRVSYVQLDRMQYYLSKPGTDWIHWTWKQRLRFMAWKSKYKRILADAQAGRCIIEYKTPKAQKGVTLDTSVTLLEMADCNIRNIDPDLLRSMKAEAAQQGKTMRDWVIGLVSASIGESIDTKPAIPNVRAKRMPASKGRDAGAGAALDIRRSVADISSHDAASCRVYRCGQCSGLGVKDSQRGL